MNSSATAKLAEEKRAAEARARDRLQFAIHAPIDAPAWFKGPIVDDVPRPVPPAPIARIAEDWIRDPIDPLADRFTDASEIDFAKQFEIDCCAWEKGKKTAQEIRDGSRFFAWRWFYADQMLLARDWK